MTRRDAADGTPSEDEVATDFTVPGDADLRPAVDEGGSDLEQEDGS
jgi:hypothetical protein